MSKDINIFCVWRRWTFSIIYLKIKHFIYFFFFFYYPSFNLKFRLKSCKNIRKHCSYFIILILIMLITTREKKSINNIKLYSIFFHSFSENLAFGFKKSKFYLNVLKKFVPSLLNQTSISFFNYLTKIHCIYEKLKIYNIFWFRI